MGSKPTTPEKTPARAELIDLTDKDKEGGASNFEKELKNRLKKSRTVMAGETGGYGGNTQLG